MYFASIINIPLWNKANWQATGFGIIGQKTLFMGPAFENEDAAKKIFSEWRQNFGDTDSNDRIDISIIEYPPEDKNFSYFVHIGSSIKGMLDDSNHTTFLLDARINEMIPTEPSPHLRFFKNVYHELGEYLLVPHVFRNGEATPLLDHAIRKCSINFKRTDQLDDNDPCKVVLNKNAAVSDIASITSKESGPKNPLDIDYCLRLFEQKFLNGQIQETFDPIVVDRIYTVERDDEGRIEPNSVDPTLLALASIVAEEEWVKHVSKTSLQSIQQKYTSILRGNFEHFERLARNRKIAIGMLPDLLSRSTRLRSSFASISSEFTSDLAAFWAEYAAAVQYHLLTNEGLKMVYGGNSFPNRKSNLWRSGLLYSDMLVVPDPIASWTRDISTEDPTLLIKFTFRDCLTALQYAPLAETKFPTVVFCPLIAREDDRIMALCVEAAKEKTCFAFSVILGRDFESYQELIDHAKELRDSRNFLSAIKDPEYFLIDIEEDRQPDVQLAIALSTQKGLGFVEMASLSDAEIAVASILGRWMQMEIASTQCSALRGYPLIDAPTSWEYYKWKIQHDAGSLHDDPMFHSTTLKANNSISGIQSVTELNKLDVKQMGDIRNSNSLQLIRAILRDTSKDLAAEMNNPAPIMEASQNRLMKLIEEYRKSHDSLNKELAGISADALLALVSGGIGVASVTSGSIPLGVIASLMGTFGTSSLRDIRQKGSQALENYRKREGNPVAFFL